MLEGTKISSKELYRNLKRSETREEQSPDAEVQYPGGRALAIALAERREQSYEPISPLIVTPSTWNTTILTEAARSGLDRRNLKIRSFLASISPYSTHYNVCVDFKDTFPEINRFALFDESRFGFAEISVVVPKILVLASSTEKYFLTTDSLIRLLGANPVQGAACFYGPGWQFGDYSWETFTTVPPAQLSMCVSACLLLTEDPAETLSYINTVHEIQEKHSLPKTNYVIYSSQRLDVDLPAQTQWVDAGSCSEFTVLKTIGNLQS